MYTSALRSIYVLIIILSFFIYPCYMKGLQNESYISYHSVGVNLKCDWSESGY